MMKSKAGPRMVLRQERVGKTLAMTGYVLTAAQLKVTLKWLKSTNKYRETVQIKAGKDGLTTTAITITNSNKVGTSLKNRKKRLEQRL